MSCVLPVPLMLAVGLRFWLRSTQKLSLKVDDWLMIPALVSQFLHGERTKTTLRLLLEI